MYNPISGEFLGQFFESASINYVEDSSTIDRWRLENHSAEGEKESIIEGGEALDIRTGGSKNDSVRSQAGDFSGSGGSEVAYAIIEEVSADMCGLAILDSGGLHARVDYDWTTDEAIGRFATDRVNSTVLFEDDGPAVDNKVVLVMMRYDAPGSGNRRVWFYPDRTGSSDGTALHHAQVEHQSAISSPIRNSGGSSQKREKDHNSINVEGSWGDEATHHLIASHFSFGSQGGRVSYGGGFNSAIAGYTGSEFQSWDGDSRNGVNASKYRLLTPYSLVHAMDRGSSSLAAEGSVDDGSHNGSFLDLTSVSFADRVNIIAKSLRIYPERIADDHAKGLTTLI
ncbi:hypothetical protein [Salinibacter altiplanensis]|uniref:hypothetical protein n=1 Tax=Salinibacter altiplanensis TaxID=1803181 RepID=UPI000C9FEC00|nr:hypothetical protein [Salinibacter altiplanensis]